MIPEGGILWEDLWVLAIAAALALLLRIWYRRRRTASLAMAVPGTGGLQTHWSWRVLLYQLSRWLLGLAILFAVLALARPQASFMERDRQAEGIDIVLVMDVSSSMLAEDFEPNRLEASKTMAQRFVANRINDRIGLVAFGEEAFTQSPLTLDHGILQRMLAGLRAGMLGDATAIGMGLATAVNRLSESDAPSKVVVLLTDGANNAGYIQPLVAANLAKEEGIRIYTIGVGSNGPTQGPVKLSDQSIQIRTMRVMIDEGLLQQMSALTGGQYFRAVDNESLAKVYEDIDQLEKRELESTSSSRYEDLFAYPLFVALGCLFIAALIRIGPALRIA